MAQPMGAWVEEGVASEGCGQRRGDTSAQDRVQGAQHCCYFHLLQLMQQSHAGIERCEAGMGRKLQQTAMIPSSKRALILLCARQVTMPTSQTR